MNRGGWVFLALLFAAPLQAARLDTVAPKMKDYRGQVVLVNFWASWCAPCQQELPELNRLAAEYKRQNKNVRVLAINVDRDPQVARKALARLNLTQPAFKIVWDRRSQMVSAFNIETMPSSYILDSHNIIRAIHAGFHPEDPAAWRKEINLLLH